MSKQRSITKGVEKNLHEKLFIEFTHRFLDEVEFYEDFVSFNLEMFCKQKKNAHSRFEDDFLIV